MNTLNGPYEKGRCYVQMRVLILWHIVSGSLGHFRVEKVIYIFFFQRRIVRGYCSSYWVLYQSSASADENSLLLL